MQIKECSTSILVRTITEKSPVSPSPYDASCPLPFFFLLMSIVVISPRGHYILMGLTPQTLTLGGLALSVSSVTIRSTPQRGTPSSPVTTCLGPSPSRNSCPTVSTRFSSFKIWFMRRLLPASLGPVSFFSRYSFFCGRCMPDHHGPCC